MVTASRTGETGRKRKHDMRFISLAFYRSVAEKENKSKTSNKRPATDGWLFFNRSAAIKYSQNHHTDIAIILYRFDQFKRQNSIYFRALQPWLPFASIHSNEGYVAILSNT